MSQIFRLAQEGRDKSDKQGRGSVLCHHLVAIPVPEEVNRAVSPALDDGPAPVVYILFTPGLDGPLCFVWSDQVHAAGAVASFLRCKTVSEGAWRTTTRVEGRW